MDKLARNLNGIEAIFLDLDGTIYMGDNLIEGAIDFLIELKNEVFVDSFCQIIQVNVKQYLSKLQNMGIPAKEKDDSVNS